jgi:hypothetical protein
MIPEPDLITDQSPTDHGALTMKPGTLIALFAALLLMVSGYRELTPPGPAPEPVPVPVPVPDPDPEPLPPPTPTEVVIKVEPPETLPFVLPTSASPQLIEAARPLAALLQASPQDGLVLARMFQSWARWLAQSPTIDNTDEFRLLYLRATTLLLKNHSIEGKYAGKIDKIITDSFKTSANLSTEGIKWSPALQTEAATVFQTLGYFAFQAYLDSLRPNPAALPGNSSVLVAP